MLLPPSASRPHRRLLPPLTALAATLVLGMVGPAVPGAWHLLGPGMLMPLIGLLLAGGAGLATYDLAQRTVSPAQPWAVAALPCALAATAMPGIGIPALLVALTLGTVVAFQNGEEQLNGFAAQAASAAGLVAACLDSPAIGSLSALAMLALAARLTRTAGRRPANDNLSKERIDESWWLPLDPGHAIDVPGIRTTSLGE